MAPICVLTTIPYFFPLPHTHTPTHAHLLGHDFLFLPPPFLTNPLSKRFQMVHERVVLMSSSTWLAHIRHVQQTQLLYMRLLSQLSHDCSLTRCNPQPNTRNRYVHSTIIPSPTQVSNLFVSSLCAYFNFILIGAHNNTLETVREAPTPCLHFHLSLKALTIATNSHSTLT